MARSMYAGRRTPGCIEVGRAYSSLTGYSRHCLKGAEVNVGEGLLRLGGNRSPDGCVIRHVANLSRKFGQNPALGEVWIERIEMKQLV